MALNYNGTSPLFIDYNFHSIYTLSYNGTEVWWRKPLVTNLWEPSSSNITRYRERHKEDVYKSNSETIIKLYVGNNTNLEVYYYPYTSFISDFGVVSDSNVESAIRYIVNHSSSDGNVYISGNYYITINTQNTNSDSNTYPAYPDYPAADYFIVIRDNASADSGGVSYQLIEPYCDSASSASKDEPIFFVIYPIVQLAAPVSSRTTNKIITITNPNPYYVQCIYSSSISGGNKYNMTILPNSSSVTTTLISDTTYYFFFADLYGNCSQSSIVGISTDGGY